MFRLESLNFARKQPLTPALSPSEGGRENCRQSVAESDAVGQSESVGESEALDEPETVGESETDGTSLRPGLLLPLPKGEGWGEGEKSVVLSFMVLVCCARWAMFFR